MLRPSVLGLALLLSAPALWAAFAAGSLDMTTALIRFLIAMPVAALMVALLRRVTASYARQALRRELTAAAEIRNRQAADRA